MYDLRSAYRLGSGARALHLASVLALAGAVAACAASQTSTGSGGGGDGGSDPGTGGEGGDDKGATTSDTGSTSTGVANACGVDCATQFTGLQPCQKAYCNDATGKCDIGADVGKACDDGLFCTVDEKCNDQSQCVGGTPNPCDEKPAKPCYEVICREDAGACIYDAQADDTKCDTTESLCETNGKCQGGVCVGQPKDCFFSPVPNDCHIAECNPTSGACEPKPKADGATCISSDLCVSAGECSAGQCSGGTAKNCSSKDDDCVVGKCDPATGNCFGDPIAAGGTCPLANPTDCTVGKCSATGTCVAEAIGAGQSCDDHKACTLNDVCDAGGTCSGTLAGSTTTLLDEDFSDNSAGWTFTPSQPTNEWQIGPATVQNTNPEGGSFKDPSDDHTTATTDKGIAGTAIGANIKDSAHGLYYIVSPKIDASAITGGLTLEFSRWLNIDYGPYHHVTVEAFNGTSWKVVWESGDGLGEEIEDSSWQSVEYDLTPHKNANLQVRWGYEVSSSIAYLTGGWNIDDVAIRSCQ